MIKWNVLRDTGERVEFLVILREGWSEPGKTIEKAKKKVLKSFLKKEKRGDFTAMFVINFAPHGTIFTKPERIPPSNWFAD